MKLFQLIKSSVTELMTKRRIMQALVIRDFESRYLSSFLGLPWAFIQPAMFILVIWFAFTFGLRSNVLQSGVPYAPWLIVAYTPWMFISQTLIVSSTSISEYSYLIKKTNFPISMIPIIKIFSGLIVHLLLIVIIMFVLIFSFHIYPNVYWFQIIYYLFAMTMLLIGLTWFISSVNVFLHDMAHIVNIVVTMLFWATPIFWPYHTLTGNLKYIALLNPFFYITEGYRYTFVEKTWFFEFTEMNILFWSFTSLMFVFGAFVFKKLEPGVADQI